MDAMGEPLAAKRTIEMLKPAMVIIPSSKEDDDNEEEEEDNVKSDIYEVERVMRHQIEENGDYTYLTKWKGYKQGTWIKAQDFNSKEPLENYWRKREKF